MRLGGGRSSGSLGRAQKAGSTPAPVSWGRQMAAGPYKPMRPGSIPGGSIYLVRRFATRSNTSRAHADTFRPPAASLTSSCSASVRFSMKAGLTFSAAQYAGQFAGHYLAPSRTTDPRPLLANGESEEFLVCNRPGNTFLHFSADQEKHKGISAAVTKDAEYLIQLTAVSDGAKPCTMTVRLSISGRFDMSFAIASKRDLVEATPLSP